MNTLLQAIVMIRVWLMRAACSHDEFIWRSNRYGVWLQCLRCGYESPGLQLRPHPGDPIGQRIHI